MKYPLALTLMLIAFASTAQKAVKLSQSKSGNTIILKEGKRVVYSLTGSTTKKVGILNSINASSLVIGDEEFQISNIAKFGRRSRGNSFWSIALPILGVGVIGSTIQNANYDPCPSCTQVESSGSGNTALGVGLGLGIIGVGIITVVRNQPKDLENGWTLEVINK